MVEGPDQTIQGTNKDDIVLLVDFKYITYGPDTIGYSPHGPNFPPTSWAGTHPSTLPRAPNGRPSLCLLPEHEPVT